VPYYTLPSMRGLAWARAWEKECSRAVSCVHPRWCIPTPIHKHTHTDTQVVRRVAVGSVCSTSIQRVYGARLLHSSSCLNDSSMQCDKDCNMECDQDSNIRHTRTYTESTQKSQKWLERGADGLPSRKTTPTTPTAVAWKWRRQMM